MDIKTFKTKKEALCELAKMVGWEAEVCQGMLSEKNRRFWVIRTKCRKYLREDGFVR